VDKCRSKLGGKDPAYVRSDADLAYTAAELVDGAFYNSGQSCCAVERIYVHESVYDSFVNKFVDIAKVSPMHSLIADVISTFLRPIGLVTLPSWRQIWGL
jgi:acyl-CoA reductase-like NAD-dependent aldehyde dehydrogenase